MLTLVKSTILCILRNPGVLVWTLAFPLILSTIFSFMFAGIEETTAERTVPLAVVADARFEEATAFRSFLDEVQTADNASLSVTFAESEDEARRLVDDGAAAAYVTVDADGMPQMAVTSSTSTTSQVDRSIVRAVLDRFGQTAAEAEILAEAAASGTAADPDRAQQAFTGTAVSISDVDVLRVDPDGYSRYFYALLGMAALMGANIALALVSQTRANCSALGARRQVSATSPGRQLACSVVSSWLGSFACLAVAFAFMRFALGVEFGGRDGLAVVALAFCALMTTGLGALIGALPRLSYGMKTGIVTACACIFSIGAGLYGEPAMELSNWLDANLPLLQAVNPATQVSGVFYDLAFYDALAPFAGALALLAATAVVFFLGAGVLMRRQSYARL